MVKAVKPAKWILLGLLIAILITGLLWYFLIVQNITDILTVEIGMAFTAEDFKLRDVDKQAHFVEDMEKVDLSVPGDYPVKIAYYGRRHESVLRLVDTVAPVVTTKDLTCFSTQYPEPEELIETLYDETAVTVVYAAAPDPDQAGVQEVKLKITDLGGNVTWASAKVELVFDTQAPVIQGVQDLRVYVGKPVDVMEGVTVTDDLDPNVVLTVDDKTADQSQEGEYTITYTAVDTCGNSTVETATMTVINDTTGPEILGVHTLSMYQGSTISYRSNLIVKDDYDDAPVLTIDSSKVDQSKPGTYDVFFTATDAAGNVTRTGTTITIKAQTSGYVDEAVIYAKADELLAKIVTEDMTAKEQVQAVYKWVKRNCGYVGSSDKTDRLQAAYRMMTRRSGDCFNYYAICSVFFDRLGLPNIMVSRSANSVRSWSGHYWNMVSLDGGESYYHVDACPSNYVTTKVCLATDATLKKCNQESAGYYTMDEGVYPATPDEAP